MIAELFQTFVYSYKIFSDHCEIFLILIFSGKPTRVQFHVTVMSLDSIDEGSMVWQ